MHSDWDKETARLKQVIEFISAQLKKKLSEKEFLIHQEADINRSMWEESGSIQDMERITDFMQYIGMLKQNMAWSKLTAGDIVRLDRQLSSPYFGRIDFAEGGTEPDRIYIGVNSLTNDETSEILVYDWRAPICGMFYDFETGPASYLCPAGKISGEITLKRQYRIEGGRLAYMFDSNLAIGDQILQEILASSSGSKMRSIVSTIQKEQNAVIRNDTARVLAVQGSAGSGKTSIAMHRASYLLYRHKKHIKSENLMIISSTDILGDYISDVLPELGEDEIKGVTFRNILQKYMPLNGFKVQSHPEYMEFALNIGNPDYYEKVRSAIRFKTSARFMDLLNRFLDYIPNHLFHFEDIYFKGAAVVSRKELFDLFNRDFSNMAPFARLKRMEKRIEERIKPLKKLLRNNKERELEEGEDYVSRQEARVLSHVQLNNEIKPLQDQMRRMFSLDTSKLYRMLFENDRIWHACLDGSAGPDSETSEFIRKYSLENFHGGRIGFEDAGPLLYLSLKLGETAEDISVKHLIVDEAQDYSPVQLLSLSRLFPSAGITILGDKSQNISPYSAEGDLETSARLISPDNYEFMRLTKSYRSTCEINEFASGILGPAPGEFFGRHGELPEVVLSGDHSKIEAAIRERIQKYVDNGAKTIAVITKTMTDAKELYQNLKKSAPKSPYPLRMMQEDYEYRIEGVMIIPSYLAKGLEFDAVIIAIKNETDYSGPDERGLFYTALTRPLHYLSIICPSGKLPAAFEKINPLEYVLNSTGSSGKH